MAESNRRLGEFVSYGGSAFVFCTCIIRVIILRGTKLVRHVEHMA